MIVVVEVDVDDVGIMSCDVILLEGGADWISGREGGITWTAELDGADVIPSVYSRGESSTSRKKC